MYDSDIRHSNASLEAKLHDLFALNRRRKGLDLFSQESYHKLLEKFGNPHLSLPPVVHIAGTNGKGSTLAMMRAMLEALGLRVHHYSSPHLVRFNERIVLAGEMISDEALEPLIDEALALNGDAITSFFEVTTAMAFAAFARTPADIVLLETGLGGRLDCTNVVPNPALTILTPVGLDHMEYLGDTIADIAAEKAGIIKAGVPCVIAGQRAEALEVMQARAQILGCCAYICGRDWDCASENNGMHFRWNDMSVPYPRPNLTGAHQVCNAGTALAAMHVLHESGVLPQWDIDALAQGLSDVQWPARLQNVSGQLAALPADLWDVWIDGGHNADAARAIADQVDIWRAEDAGRDLHIICAMVKNKDARAFLGTVTQHAVSVSAVPVAYESKAMSADELRGAFPDKVITAYDSLDQAIDSLTSQHPDGGRLLICGSLYLAGEVLRSLS